MIGWVVLSLSPVLFAELNGAPQIGRAYFPAFIGFLILIGQACFQFEQRIGFVEQRVFWMCIIAFVFVSTVWNLRVFLTDVWPARMAGTWLTRKLKSLGIEKFYTYDTPYNDAFVNVLDPEVHQKFDVQFIRSLSEVREGYVVVPGTSAKALNMEGQDVAIQQGDFNLDPALTRMIETKLITRYAVASFKTMGTSRTWVQDMDITTYRDLILREITEADRWRGRGWILDVSRLNAERMHRGSLTREAGAISAGSAL